MSARAPETINHNIATIQGEISKLAAQAQMDTVPSPTLIAVSKRQPEARIEDALAAGQRVFGENKVQEAETHWAARRGNWADLELHLIGPLQTNKVNKAMALFDVIQTVDRTKLADKIKTAADREGRCPRLFIQVNTGAEPQKAGVPVEHLADLVNHIRALDLPLEGLMCIPPADDDAALHFALLKKLAKRYGLSGLSMGMSSDYALASVMGATHIRVGTALFGPREDQDSP